ncbi:acyl-CoA dehydrogenase [Amycolatopsis anabasis]|uniref:acyl-CoA dehydrogenase n=1 Tax=Amycolatopsis anabasis TaxID=1840409 RepID=UPI001FEC259C|nr:acyl-CoA dehydrogenase [Amycolatopsis anabasis]
MTKTVLQRKLVSTLEFMLHEWLGVTALFERPHYAEHSAETVDDLLRAASEIAADCFEPAARVSDLEEPFVDDGRVLLPKATHEAWEAYRSFGFLSAAHDAEHGGMQLPRTVDLATRLIFTASGPNLIPSMLTDANASLLLAHGTETQQRVFALPELAGRWTGTMCLSEPQAGSSLSDITTRAVPDGAGHETDPLGPRYRITGNKMWISSAEHELTENIVHLVLAKIPGADGAVDPSTRGISLFIVPKVLVNENAAPTERNDVALIGLNHKLGNRGIPNAALAFGDGTYEPRGGKGAIGYLVGRPGDGLRQMFHMMNAARIEIGLGAAAVGLAAYAVSLDYAKERRQGRHLTAQGKDATRPQVPIIEHADVKRMLLAQKAYSEGAVALGLFAARLLDDQRTGSAEEARSAGMLLELLTPVVKSWPSEWCLEANNLAIQVLGGAGYTRDFPVEMYWRDQRINMIHEGTHGIQALDLLGRKVRVGDGANLAELGRKVRATADAARQAGFPGHADDLAAGWQRVRTVTDDAWSTSDPVDALANATPYLQGFGHVVLAWILLDLAVAAAGSSHAEAPGKIAAMRYFYAYELPKVSAWFDVVARREPLCRDVTVAEL